jgi:uncharacterized protein YecT (DUF1311 family)
LNHHTKSKVAVSIVFIWILSCCSFCFALDNPDGPDRIAEFEAKSKSFENNIQKKAQNEHEIALAYTEYEKFLDGELNRIYVALMQQLNEPSKQKLLASQRRWLQYRDAEFLFISTNWTVENFGSSSTISRSGFRTIILRDRIVGLLHYLQNYGETSR